MAAEVGGRSFDHNLIDSDSDDEIYHDHITNSLGPPEFDIFRSPSPVGGQLPLSNIENNLSLVPSFDTITVALSNFHIHTASSKENIEAGKAQARRGRPQLDKNTFDAPKLVTRSEDQGLCDHLTELTQAATSSQEQEHTQEDFEKYNPVAFASRNLPSSQEQLSKHQAGQFEWVLSIPVSHSAKGSRSFSSSHEDPEHPDETRKLFFGCNLVHRRTQSGGLAGKPGNSANRYTLLATQLDGDELSSTTQPGTIGGIEPMSATHITDSDTTIIRTSEADMDDPREPMTSEDATGPENDDMAEHILTHPVEDPMPRIEDSVEALDKLEEELEAATEVAALDRVLSPGDMAESPKPSRDTPTKPSMLPRSNSTTKRSTTTSARTRTVDRTSSFRKSTSLVFSMEEEKPVRSALKKSTVSRPTSLLPPKAPVKSTKPPTVATFELPGEAVARRLKEQRAARLSQHLSSEQAAATYSPSKSQVKSTKPPTRPTFELPGDAISRRKREEREAKLRAQEEEERRRREFKARPIRASIPPSSYPRETIASKARRGKLSQGEEPAENISPVAKKRQSLTLTAMTVPRPSVSTGMHLSATLPSRGRTSVAGTNGAQISRATSTASTASIHGGSSSGKRSTVSAEDMQQQKLRGKEIMSRENSFVADRERERREREEATKLARKEAAERSRQISREWAEKQRLRKEEGRSS